MRKFRIASLVAAMMFAIWGVKAQEQQPTPAAEATKQVTEQTTATAEQAEEQADEPQFPEDAQMMDYRRPKQYVIRDVKVQGIKYLDPNILIATSGIVRGDSAYIPGNYIKQAEARLWSQRYFSDVKIGAEIAGDSVDLVIMLQERPRVFRWLFEGIGRAQASDILDKLKLKRNGELSDYILDKNTKLIKEYYAEKGFRNAEVTTRIVNDSVVKNAVNVTFVIKKNPRVKIGEIVFSGNDSFKEKRLRRAMKKTHQKSINFFVSSKLNEEEYENDKINVIDFYNSKGYRNATILSDSIYPINEKRIGIKIDLSEGNKYYYRNISWVGNSVYPTEALDQMLGIKGGDTYDKKTLHKRLGIGREENPEEVSVKSSYQNSGYLMSQIDPAEIIVGADSIDLELKIFEGKQFSINDVHISGNDRLDDEVIRREIYTRPGELYNRALLMQTIRTLGAMGHFDAEKISPNIQPVSNELVDVSWALEETASDQFNIAGGWGADTFVGSVGITLNNLSVKRLFKKGAWRPYPQGQNQRLNITAQTNGTYYKSASISFTDPWLGGKKPNSLTIGFHWSEENDAYYVWQSSTQHFRAMGLSAGIGRRLNWPDPYFTLYTELAYQRYALKDWDYFIMKNGKANVVALRAVLSRNSVDQPLYPRRGSEFTVSVALTPPHSAWDGKDYTNKEMSDQERYRWIEYHKWDLKAQWFYPLSKNNNLVLMASAEMGFLGNYNKNKLSPFELYDVGGDGMSGYSVYGVDVIRLRGYEDSALNPVGSNSMGYSRVYNKYTVEMRYPIIMKPSSTIYGLVFVEGGNGFNSWKEFSPFKIKRSAGAGVRMYLPVVGMLGIDWAWGFDPPAGGTKRSGSQFHFMIGQQF